MSMVANNLSIYPIVNCCSASLVDKNTYVRELIFTYCRKTCKHCPLANKSIRKMSPEAVYKHIHDAVQVAKSKQLSKVQIQLIGGDMLGAWEEFIGICRWIEQVKWELPVSLGAVICGCNLTQEKQEWLLQNGRRIQLIYRWDEITGLANWVNYSLLRHPMVGCVQWFVTPKTIPRMKSELSMLLRYGKRIQLEFFELESWSSDDYTDFFAQLGKLIIEEYRFSGPLVLHQFGLEYQEQCSKQVDTIDVTGKCYRCRYLSPERMIHSTLLRYYSKDQESGMCDAAGEILVRRPIQQKFAEHYSFFLQNINDLLCKNSIDFSV